MGKTKMQAGWKLIATAMFVSVLAGCGGDEEVSSTPTAEEMAQDKATLYKGGVNAYQDGDLKDAFRKFKILADKGDAEGQFNIGVMYHEGRGVDQNDVEAVSWWTKAAEQGNASAQDNLGLRYAKGEGVTRDIVQAYKWFAIAAMAGKSESARSNMKVVEARLTPEEIGQGQVMAKKWMMQQYDKRKQPTLMQ